MNLAWLLNAATEQSWYDGFGKRMFGKALDQVLGLPQWYRRQHRFVRASTCAASTASRLLVRARVCVRVCGWLTRMLVVLSWLFSGGA